MPKQANKPPILPRDLIPLLDAVLDGRGLLPGGPLIKLTPIQRGFLEFVRGEAQQRERGNDGDPAVGSYLCDKLGSKNSRSVQNSRIKESLLLAIPRMRPLPKHWPEIEVSEGKTAKICWAEWPPHVPDRRTANDCVIWYYGRPLGLFGRYAFAGGTLMAKELDVACTIQTLSRDVIVGKKLSESIRSMHKGVTPDRVGILLHVCPDVGASEHRFLEHEGYKVVKAGTGDGGVVTNNKLIGRNLAEYALDNVERFALSDPASLAVLVAGEPVVDLICEERKAAFIHKVRDQGPVWLQPADRIPVFQIRSDQRDRALASESGVEKLLRKELSKTKLIFATTGELAEGAARAIRRASAKQKVLSVDLTTPLFRIMEWPDSPLDATCGLDPFNLGRYLLRLATDRSVSTEVDSTATRLLGPTLVTSETIQRLEGIQDFASAAQNRGPAIRFEQSRQADCWPLWMRYYCPALHEKIPDALSSTKEEW